MAEWERLKRDNEQKRQEEVRKRVLQHTGNLLKDFEKEAGTEQIFEGMEDVPKDTVNNQIQTEEFSEEMFLQDFEKEETAENQNSEEYPEVEELEEIMDISQFEEATEGDELTESEDVDAVGEEEQKPLRIVQDYNELLYGDLEDEPETETNETVPPCIIHTNETQLEENEFINEDDGISDSQNLEEMQIPEFEEEIQTDTEDQQPEVYEQPELFQPDMFEMESLERVSDDDADSDQGEFSDSEKTEFAPIHFEEEETDSDELSERMNRLSKDIESTSSEEFDEEFEEDSLEEDTEDAFIEETEAIEEVSYEQYEMPSEEEEEFQVSSKKLQSSLHTYENDSYMTRAVQEQLAGVVDQNTEYGYEEEMEEASDYDEPQMRDDEILDFTDEPLVNSYYERKLTNQEVIRNTREFTPSEEELFGSFLRTKKAKEQLIYAIDNITMASYTGNIIITGDNMKENMNLAKNLIREVQQNDDNFSGSLGKISAKSLNQKDVDSILRKVDNGAIIIEGAGMLTRDTVNKLVNSLEQENRGIILILMDYKMSMDKLLSTNPALHNNFNARIDIEEMSTEELQAYGKAYAYEKEFGIEEMGMLELFSKIEQLQTMGHKVTPQEVEQIIDHAIRKATKPSLKHFSDVIFNKRYDEEDMIVLKPKDFN